MSIKASEYFGLLLVASLIVGSTGALAQEPQFGRQVLTRGYYCDGVTAGDINSDGKLDLVAGPFWYEGPEFKKSHEFYKAVEIPRAPSPSNSMFSFVHDFSGDGRPDILVLGRVHKHPAVWYENPGESTELWKSHFAFERVRGESPTMVDLDGDGVPQVITHWEGRWGWIEPDPTAPSKPWKFTSIGDDEQWPQFYHGEGVGDVNDDGRLDVIINDGWYEQPKKLESKYGKQNWKLHRMRFSRERGGAQMFATDVDGDGDNDVVSSLHAHEWGLAWFEQSSSGKGVRFTEHTIMGDRSQIGRYKVAFSQPHALAMADIDGDGLKDIVIGKRRWAHGPEGDIEPGADPVVYWFRLERTPDGSARYTPHLIDDKSGVGVQILATDVDGDGRNDVVTASKLGVFLFRNRASAN